MCLLMDNVKLMDLIHECNRLEDELSVLTEQAGQKESEISKLNVDIKELRIRIEQTRTNLADYQKRIADIDSNKIREQIEDWKEKKRD